MTKKTSGFVTALNKPPAEPAGETIQEAAPAAVERPAVRAERSRPPLAVPVGRMEPVRMLGGRVPDSVFRQFSRLKETAELQLGVRKVTNEQGLEAMVRALETDPEARAAWFRALQAVRDAGR